MLEMTGEDDAGEDEPMINEYSWLLVVVNDGWWLLMVIDGWWLLFEQCSKPLLVDDDRGLYYPSSIGDYFIIQ